MKKVLVVGDSLTFGRPKYEIFQKDTWPGLLESRGYDVWHRGSGGSTSKDVLSEIRQLHNYLVGDENIDPPMDIFLIQVGIVDCTPRLLPKRVISLLQFLPFGSYFVRKLNRSQFLVSYFGKPWVSLEEFEQNFREIVHLASRLASRVFIIEIAQPIHCLIENCGDFSNQVYFYNRVLRNLDNVIFIDVYGDRDLRKADLFLEDGHHLTKVGHKRIANQILNII